jgi:hypothetical protein
MSLKEISSDVPNLPGVYYIVKLAEAKVSLVYIGKSGTVMNNGKFKDQGINGRLNNKQEGMKREEFFDKKCQEKNIDALDIYWFVTIDKEYNDLPGFVEGTLMQRFYEVYGKLPEWNKEY